LGCINYVEGKGTVTLFFLFFFFLNFFFFFFLNRKMLILVLMVFLKIITMVFVILENFLKKILSLLGLEILGVQMVDGMVLFVMILKNGINIVEKTKKNLYIILNI
jgi:hypothetical protein